MCRVRRRASPLSATVLFAFIHCQTKHESTSTSKSNSRQLLSPSLSLSLSPLEGCLSDVGLLHLTWVVHWVYWKRAFICTQNKALVWAVVVYCCSMRCCVYEWEGERLCHRKVSFPLFLVYDVELIEIIHLLLTAEPVSEYKRLAKLDTLSHLHFS